MCTGVAASWCPNCGDCMCPYDEDFGYLGDRNDPSCPLHGPQSLHAEVRFRSQLAEQDKTPVARMTR